MTRLGKMLRLIGLLSNRDGVDLETIMRLCELPRRTAFRYMRRASEAGIPVYYDRDLRGYRLAANTSLGKWTLDLTDTVFVVVCLRLISAKLGVGYKSEADRIISELVARQTWPIEELISAYEAIIESDTPVEEWTSVVSQALVHAGILSGRSVTLHSADDREETTLDFTVPVLEFNEEWQLSDKGSCRQASVPLSSVKKVEIC